MHTFLECRAMIWAVVTAAAIGSVASGQRANAENLPAEDPAARSKATLEELAWMVGSWQGDAFGGSVEEDWQAASGGAMAGMFKLVHQGRASLYEFMTIVEEDESLELRLKHFDSDFSSWEDKAEYVSFPLVRLAEDAVYFEGLSYRRLDRDRLMVNVSIGEDQEVTSIEFVRRSRAEPVPAPEPERSPYAGMQERPIKALSEAQIAGYRAGDGMGFAMAAELNGYPGPKHVLELAEKLDLTADQLEATRGAFDRMRAAARALGERLVEAEGKLDRLFAAHSVSEATLEAATTEIARLTGELRAVHLGAHLEMVEILTPVQRHAYMTIRGYFDGSTPAGHHPGMHHGHED